MSDRDAFLRAIRAAPADDTPRLVFADYLDETGDPDRAEFVRLQVELEPLRESLDDPRVQALLDREEVLLARNRAAWLGPAAVIAEAAPQYGPVFVRGFPESVCVSLDTFRRRGGELFAACPTLREVAVFAVAGRGRELADCPYLWNVETLEVADWPEAGDNRTVAGDVGQLADGPHADRLRRLRLWLGPAFTTDWSVLGRLLQARLPGVEHVEFVRLAALPSPPWPGAPRDVADAMIVELARALAPRAVTLSRPFDRRFPLLGDVGRGFYAGTLPSGAATLAVVMPNPRVVSLTSFDDDGRVSKTLWEERRSGEWTLPGLGERFGFRPGLIRVREFGTHTGVGLRLWPAELLDLLRSPFDRPADWDDARWRDRGGVVRWWLGRGRFALVRGREEFWADGSGKIVDWPQ